MSHAWAEAVEVDGAAFVDVDWVWDWWGGGAIVGVVDWEVEPLVSTARATVVDEDRAGFDKEGSVVEDEADVEDEAVLSCSDWDEGDESSWAVNEECTGCSKDEATGSVGRERFAAFEVEGISESESTLRWSTINIEGVAFLLFLLFLVCILVFDSSLVLFYYWSS